MRQQQGTLSGRLAWVSGGSRGMGLESAMALARAGARVVVSGRDAAQLAAAVQAAPGLDVQSVAMDVTDRDSVFAAADEIQQRFGAVDILVNSAGINVAQRSWSQIAPADFERVVSVNLSGSMYCTLAVLPAMRRRSDGQIINIVSWAGKFVSGMTGPAYTASKHAVGALTMSLNTEECVNGIRACAIYPGEVATPMLQARAIPPSPQELARMLQPEQVAAAVRFVAEMPPTACINEIVISPTWNRAFPATAAQAQQTRTNQEQVS